MKNSILSVLAASACSLGGCTMDMDDEYSDETIGSVSEELSYGACYNIREVRKAWTWDGIGMGWDGTFYDDYIGVATGEGDCQEACRAWSQGNGADSYFPERTFRDQWRCTIRKRVPQK